MDERDVLRSPPVPAHAIPATGSLPALDDPATAESYLRAKRRARLPVWLAAGPTVITWVAAWMAERAGQAGLTSALTVAGIVLGIGTFLTVATHPIRARDVRMLWHALGTPWRRVEVIAMAGAPAGSTCRVVVVLDPHTGQPAGSWLVAVIRTPRWLHEDQRQWMYLAVAADGLTAALAPVDRSEVAVLRSRAGFGSDAVHEWARKEADDRWELEPPASSGSSETGASGLGARIGSGQRHRWSGRRLRARDRLLILGALVLLASLLTVREVATQRSDAEHAAGLLRDGSRTTAVVVSSSAGGARRGPPQIVVEYGTGNGWIYHVRRSVVSDQRPSKGSVVRIAYDPADPTDMTFVDIDEESGDVIAYLAWVAVVIVGARFAWGAYRRRTLAIPSGPDG